MTNQAWVEALARRQVAAAVDRMRPAQEGDKGSKGDDSATLTVSVSGHSFGAQSHVSMSSAPNVTMMTVPPMVTAAAFHVMHGDALSVGSPAPTASVPTNRQRHAGRTGEKPGSRPGSPYSALNFIADFLFTNIMNHGLCVSLRARLDSCLLVAFSAVGVFRLKATIAYHYSWCT